MLDAVLAAYLEAVERGEKPDRAQLIAANPDLAAELRELWAVAQFAHLARR